LLHIAEYVVRRDPKKPHLEGLVAAHERLWQLRHPIDHP
jgi:hypothetical protein